MKSGTTIFLFHSNVLPFPECDTDDEIEKVLQKQKAKQRAASDEDKPSAAAAGADAGASTDEEAAAPAPAHFGGALPHFLDGHTFVIDADGDDAHTLTRYVKAYGGLVLQVYTCTCFKRSLPKVPQN